MKRKIKIILIVVAILLLLFSYIFLSQKHDYDLVNIEDVSTDENFVNITYSKEENVINDDVLGILSIEKIGLIATVKEGSTNDVLKEYVGHISETSKYDGNIGLAAHNRGNKYSYFARINELEKGDIIVYKTKFYTRKYKVERKIVIYETDWKVLEDDGANKLTLITCIAGKEQAKIMRASSTNIKRKEDKLYEKNF